LSKPDDHMILPEIISKEPLGPVVRQGDDQWFNVVKWVHFALLDAEELGVTCHRLDPAGRDAWVDTVLSAIVYRESDWDSPIYRATTFHSNVEQDGIAL
jgi:hypothetical protein